MNIADLAQMDLDELYIWFDQLPQFLSKNEIKIGEDVIKEIKTRLQFLLNVGLNYLSLNRSSKSLSGGEAQRIRLATQIGSKLVGVLYILDEPTTGLHFEDIRVLLEVLTILVEKGNTVLIIEHNLDVIKQVDYIIDIGLEGGRYGGELICQGTPEEIIKHKKSYTAKFLNNEFNSQLTKNLA